MSATQNFKRIAQLEEALDEALGDLKRANDTILEYRKQNQTAELCDDLRGQLASLQKQLRKEVAEYEECATKLEVAEDRIQELVAGQMPLLQENLRLKEEVARLKKLVAEEKTKNLQAAFAADHQKADPPAAKEPPKAGGLLEID